MTKITEQKDDALYQEAMFSAALGDKYLGSPSVVGALVADYCLAVRELLVQRSAGTLDAAECVARINEMGSDLSVIFTGHDPSYTAIIGWNAITLGAHLKVALGVYWTNNRAAHGDDPVRVLFAWLCWAVHDAMQRAHGDEDLEGVILSENTHSAIRLLLGAERRA